MFLLYETIWKPYNQNYGGTNGIIRLVHKTVQRLIMFCIYCEKCFFFKIKMHENINTDCG